MDKRVTKFKIGVSGSAENNCTTGTFKKARLIGRLIAEHKAVTVTGDTTGVPYESAVGAKEADGITVGISPAHSQVEHEKKYHLPLNNMDLVIYTGFAYSGRNLLFIRACDAVIFICGRIGTLNEFTIAFEDNKPIGILTETGGITSEIDHILEVAHRGHRKVIFDSDPEKLVNHLLKILEEEQE